MLGTENHDAAPEGQREPRMPLPHPVPKAAGAGDACGAWLRQLDPECMAVDATPPQLLVILAVLLAADPTARGPPRQLLHELQLENRDTFYPVSILQEGTRRRRSPSARPCRSTSLLSHLSSFDTSYVTVFKRIDRLRVMSARGA